MYQEQRVWPVRPVFLGLTFSTCLRGISAAVGSHNQSCTRITSTRITWYLPFAGSHETPVNSNMQEMG